MQIIARPSPNFNARKSGVIDMLVLHYTGMQSCDAALARLCDSAAKVSAHYLIDEDGQVYRLVAEDQRAWHAGVSCWAGERDVNSRAIGIELVNPGHEFGYQTFPQPQMQALAELSLEILSRHPIPPHFVLGHSDVAPGRKRDPGELFDWAWLAGQGVGLWSVLSSHLTPPQPLPIKGEGLLPPGSGLLPPPGGEGWGGGPEIMQLQKDLARFGYDIPQTGFLGVQTRAVITAFQRHFRPAKVDGVADAQTAAILKQLLAQITA